MCTCSSASRLAACHQLHFSCPVDEFRSTINTLLSVPMHLLLQLPLEPPPIISFTVVQLLIVIIHESSVKANVSGRRLFCGRSKTDFLDFGKNARLKSTRGQKAQYK